MIYLSHPFDHPMEAVKERRLDQVAKWASIMVDKYFYYLPIHSNTPLVEYLGDKGANWLERDFLVIMNCRAMHVLQLIGWEESKGVRSEIIFANRMGIPITMITWEEIEEAFRKWDRS